MLVLSRKIGERVIIGDGIEITVVDIDRGKVRLGITADKTVPIFRAELLVETEATQPPSLAERP